MYKLYKNKKKYKFKESFDFFSYPLILNNVEVSIVDERIIKIFIKSNINFDFSKLASKVIIFLDNDSDSDADDGTLLLSELNNLSNMIFNLYADYFTKTELNYYMRNIRLLVQEIKKRVLLKEQSMENSMRSRRSR